MQFEAGNTASLLANKVIEVIAGDEHTLCDNVRRAWMRVNTRKAAGPSGISG